MKWLLRVTMVTISMLSAPDARPTEGLPTARSPARLGAQLALAKVHHQRAVPLQVDVPGLADAVALEDCLLCPLGWRIVFEDAHVLAWEKGN